MGALAGLCTVYLLIGNAGVIHRSLETCYPIPEVVEERLRDALALDDLTNIHGPEDSTTHGLYCVRCLVWRPPSEQTKSHHCRTCQRCVTGFDHHCGVFGRCIVLGNMPCFFTLICLMCTGIMTAMVGSAVTSEPVGTDSHLLRDKNAVLSGWQANSSSIEIFH